MVKLAINQMIVGVKNKKKKSKGGSSNYEEKKKKECNDKSSQKKRSESPTLLVIDTCLVREDDAIWSLDSRAIRHVTPHKDWFIDYKLLPKRQTIFVGNDTQCQIKGIGTIPILLNNGVFNKITNVLHVPNMTKNILSAQEFRRVVLEFIWDKTFILKTSMARELLILKKLMVFSRLVTIHRMTKP